MKHPLVIAVLGIALTACSAANSGEESAELRTEQAAAMVKATHENHCAVLTEIKPGEHGYSGDVPNQLLEITSETVTDTSTHHAVGDSVARDTVLSTAAAPRGWKLSAPCIVWRPALVAGETGTTTSMEGQVLPTRVGEKAGTVTQP